MTEIEKAKRRIVEEKLSSSVNTLYSDIISTIHHIEKSEIISNKDVLLSKLSEILSEMNEVENFIPAITRIFRKRLNVIVKELQGSYGYTIGGQFKGAGLALGIAGGGALSSLAYFLTDHEWLVPFGIILFGYIGYRIGNNRDNKYNEEGKRLF
jgi:hypothetical protein